MSIALWLAILATACGCAIGECTAKGAADGRPAAVHYIGTTSQRPGRYQGNQRLPSNQVAFSYSGDEVQGFSIPWVASCAYGTPDPLLDRVRLLGALTVRDGSFHLRGSYSFRPGPHQSVFVNAFSLGGRIRGDRATGTLSIHASFQDDAECETAKPIRWSAVTGARRADLAFPTLDHPARYFPETPILYTRTDAATGASAIYLTGGESYPKLRVTSPPPGASDSNPAASPSQVDMMAFQRTVAGTSQIYIGDPAGGSPTTTDSSGLVTLVTTRFRDGRDTNFSAGASDPAVSPDGAKIAFSVGTGADCSLWIMNVDGSGQTQLTDHGATPGCDAAPAWSPDGKSVAFRRTITDAAGNPAGASEMAVPATGGTPSELSFPAPVAGFSWAPRNALLFVSPGGATTLPSLQAVNPDGTGDRTVISVAGLIGRPAWSPTSDRDAITFTESESDGSTEIATVPVAGGLPVAIANTPGTSASDPIWVVLAGCVIPRCESAEPGPGMHVVYRGGGHHRPHRP